MGNIGRQMLNFETIWCLVNEVLTCRSSFKFDDFLALSDIILVGMEW